MTMIVVFQKSCDIPGFWWLLSISSCSGSRSYLLMRRLLCNIIALCSIINNKNIRYHHLIPCSNFVCHISASPKLKPTYMLLSSSTSWPSVQCCTHSPFMLQILGMLNRVVCATSNGYNKTCVRILAPGALLVPNHVRTLEQSNVTLFCKKIP